MADIFISYAREDEATARQLRDVLASQGWNVWRDKEGIVTGTSWGESIEHALNDAKCVVVLWSKHALASHFVRDEAEIGRNANKLIPVQIGDVELPIGFRGIQTANLVQWNADVDDRRAVGLFRHAADLNNASGLNNLGYMYETGRGIGVDLNAAVALYKRAADLGDRNAVSNLSRVQERLRNQPTRH